MDSDKVLIGVIGLIGVVVGALITAGLAEWREHRKEKRERKRKFSYLAVRISCILDGFVDSCADVVGDDGLWCGQRDPEGCLGIQVSTPDIDFQSIDVDWHSLPPLFMYEILKLPNDVVVADGAIKNQAEHIAGPPDYEEVFEERQYQYSELGLIASKLSDRLRKDNDLPNRNFEGWDCVQVMKDKKAEIDTRREIRAKRFEED